MVTEARKRANAKWDKENMTIIGCKVKKDYACQIPGCLCSRRDYSKRCTETSG